MGNKPKGNEALSEAMRGQLGTTREVFTNSNGSNVILERVGDGGKRDNSAGSPDIDAEEEEEPEEDEEDEAEGESSGGCIQAPNPNKKPVGCGTNIPPQKKARRVRISKELQAEDEDEPKFFNGKTTAQNEKIKNVYEAMKKQIDEQLNHYYKTGKFTIDPTQMINKVFHNIMGKYGYKSVFNNWFKNVAEKHTGIKKAWEKYQTMAPTKFAKKLKGKLTLANIGKLLKLKPGFMSKLNKTFKLVKVLRNISSNPIGFMVNAFTKTGGLSSEMGALVNALGSNSAGDLLSYVITLLIA